MSDVGEPPLEHARPHRFTLDEYLRLSEQGFFERRVELIDGEIIDMASQKDPHTFAVTMGTRWCNDAFPLTNFWVRVQTTLVTGESSPEPDIAVVDYPASPTGSYALSDRAVLVIEVAESTLLADTTTKMSLYAANGVRDYWVVSIPDQQLIVYRNPVLSPATRHGHAYADVGRFIPGQSITPLAMPSAVIDPKLLLG